MMLFLGSSTSLSVSATSQNTLAPSGGEIERLVYNRIAKTGSSAMLGLLELLSKRNGFPLVAELSPENFYPNASQLAETVRALPTGAVYINHCAFAEGAPPDVGFINMVRDPLDRSVSSYYYAVDPENHEPKMVYQRLEGRKLNGICGCVLLEAYACVLAQNASGGEHGCEPSPDLAYIGSATHPFHDLDVWNMTQSGVQRVVEPSQLEYFCAPQSGASCSEQVAWGNLKHRYSFVGLTEEFERSVLMLERLLPRWFAGSSELLKTHPHTVSNPTSDFNWVTNTSLTGFLSRHAKQILHEKGKRHVRFYEQAKAHFWSQAAATLGAELEEPLTHIF